MSLEDFFNKRNKRKSKKTINAQELFEKFTAGSQQQTNNREKSPHHVDHVVNEDNGEWDPIVNDYVDVDFSDLRINDMSVSKMEETPVSASAIIVNEKSENPKVVWGGSAKSPEGEEQIQEAPKQTEKPGVYVPIHMRTSGISHTAAIQAQELPNLDSTEDFPSLDAAAFEKPKKSNPPPKQDTSWTDVTKSSTGHRMDDSAFVNRSVANASYNVRDEPTWTSSSRGESVRSGGWNRGEALKPRSQPNEPAPPLRANDWSRGAVKSSESSKAYVIPQQRNIMSFTQENRFSQLEDA